MSYIGPCPVSTKEHVRICRYHHPRGRLYRGRQAHHQKADMLLGLDPNSLAQF
jgi:hypothetical protein